jgi:Uma2 family endonuclease
VGDRVVWNKRGGEMIEDLDIEDEEEDRLYLEGVESLLEEWEVDEAGGLRIESDDIGLALDIQSKHYSPEEYLAIEVQSEVRHEFRSGEVVEMPRTMPNHNLIRGNFCAEIHRGLRSRAFEVFVAAQRLWIPKNRLYTYPDIMVVDGKLQLQEGRNDTAINPLLIVDLISYSTRNHDQADKFAAYRSIPSFREYLLLSQYDQHIEHYVKTSAKRWNFQEYDETDKTVRLESIDLEVALADVYDKVVFEVPRKSL